MKSAEIIQNSGNLKKNILIILLIFSIYLPTKRQMGKNS